MTSDTAAPDVPLDLLLPAAERLDPDPAERRLASLYATGDGPHVRANMISTVDGGAWGPDHLSGSLNDDADWRVFRVLRALADVVLVGAGTARAEGYRELRRPRGPAGARPRPLELALVTRTGRLPAELAADRPLVLTTRDGARVARESVPPDRVVVAEGPRSAPGEVDLALGLAALTDRGLAAVLCEGGPHLLEAMLRAGLVDELCVTTSPLLVGAAPGRIVAGTGGPGPAAGARPARLAHLLHAPGPGTLLARWDLRPA